jgi:hypothetical protein
MGKAWRLVYDWAKRVPWKRSLTQEERKTFDELACACVKHSQAKPNSRMLISPEERNVLPKMWNLLRQVEMSDASVLQAKFDEACKEAGRWKGVAKNETDVASHYATFIAKAIDSLSVSDNDGDVMEVRDMLSELIDYWPGEQEED